MDLRQYLQAVRQRWFVVLIPLVVGAGLGVLFVARTDPEYQGSMTFFVKTLQDSSPNAAFQGDQFAQRRVNSYVALLSSERLAEAIIQSAELDLTPKEVSSSIGATGDINTVLFDATVTTSSEELTTEITDALATEFVELVETVENPPGGPATVHLELVSGPKVTEVFPRKVLAVGAGATAGFVVGLGLCLFLGLRDTSLRDRHDVEAAGAGPLLASIPFDRNASATPLVMLSDLRSVQAEAFRRLRTNLQFLHVEWPIKVLVVTSSVAEEGKSTVSANLALAVAASGRRVLLIEADFRRPRIAEYFGLEGSVGITDVLAERAELDDVVQPWADGNLMILPSGRLPPNPSELLGCDAMAKLLTQFRSDFSLVVIDTPPLLPVTDAAVVATRADGAIVVAQYGRTTHNQLSMSVNALQTVGTRLLGSVLTMVPARSSSRYDSYSVRDEVDTGTRETGTGGTGPQRTRPRTERPTRPGRTGTGTGSRQEPSRLQPPVVSSTGVPSVAEERRSRSS